jgi:type II secretory pathway component PulC
MSIKTRMFPAMALAASLAGPAAAGLAAEPEQKAAEADKQAAESAAATAEIERKLADARQRLDEAAREVATLSMSLSEDVVPHMRTFGAFGSGPSRAVLGISLGPRDEPAGNGVAILSVSPGGPADGAGLKAGDVLTEVNGTALKRDDDDSAREKLLATMRKVKAGDSVAVTYRRDGKVAKATLVAQPLKDRFFTMAVPPPPGAMGPMPAMGSPFAIMGRFGFAEALFGSAELVALTPKLGQYFGTETGLLVVHAPDDSRLKLEDGDVIVDIDGRKPSSPSHALRILTSYQQGEKVKLNILRNRKRMTLDVTVPEHSPEQGLEGALERRLKHFDGRFDKRVMRAPAGAASPWTTVLPAPPAGPISVPLPDNTL